MKKYIEDNLQNDCFIYLNNNHGLKHHSPRLLMFSVPNEGATKLAMTLKLKGVNAKVVNETLGQQHSLAKSMGLTDGVSDSIVVMPSCVLFIEFKVGTNNQQPNQVDFQNRVEGLNHKYYVCRSLEQFKQIINENLKP